MIPWYKSFTHHPFNHPSFDRTLTWYSRLRLVYIVTKTNRIHNRLWVAFKLYVPSLLYSPFWIATSSWQLFCGNRIREGITLLTVSSSSSSLLDSISSDSFSILDRFFCKITIFISSATIHVHFFEFDLRISNALSLMYVSGLSLHTVVGIIIRFSIRIGIELVSIQTSLSLSFPITDYLFHKNCPSLSSTSIPLTKLLLIKLYPI